MDIVSLLGLSRDSLSLLTVEATVVTGFETIAMLECIDKFGPDLNICKSRGRVCFNIEASSLFNIKKLRSVDNLYLVVQSFEDVNISNNATKDDDLNLIKELVNDIQWNKCLETWALVTNYDGIIFPTLDQYLSLCKSRDPDVCNISGEKLDNGASYWGDEIDNNALLDDILKIVKYRVTCHRVGKHLFTSQEAAYDFGGLLQDRFNWVVNLDNYDLEILLRIIDRNVTVLLALTESSLHRRNLTHFGRTTLRATVSNNMLRFANITSGETVMDPLCGSGSIPIEGALGFPGTFHICGDIEEKSVELTKLNVQALSNHHTHIPVDVFRWNASALPLNDSSVDAVITDLPFGKRVGSKVTNKILYFDVLKELARVVKPDTGRGVFLTTNRRTFNTMLQKNRQYWKHDKMLVINMGGLRAFVYLIQRTITVFV